MLEGRFIIVVVPAFQEEAHIGRVVSTMPSFVDQVFVIDDGSTDRTSTLAASSPRVRVIRHPRRRGVGAALATGYRAALDHLSRSHRSSPEDAIAVMAGDGQMCPNDLEAVVAPVVRGEAEYVKGDRFRDPDVRRTMGSPRWLGGRVFSRLTSLAIGQSISDSQCGFTALSRGAALALDLEGLWPSFGYPNDLLGQLATRGARIREVAVRPIYGSEVSKLRLRHLPPIFFLIARAALRRARRRPAERADDIGPVPNTRSEDRKSEKLPTGSAVSS